MLLYKLIDMWQHRRELDERSAKLVLLCTVKKNNALHQCRKIKLKVLQRPKDQLHIVRECKHIA